MQAFSKSQLQTSPRRHRKVTLRIRRLAAIGGALLFVSSVACGPPSGESADDEVATVYYDDYGIPHIYSESEEAALYASGWAQAHDRLEQLLKNYLLGLGEYSAAFGPGDDDRWLRSDLESRMWDHYGTSQRNYSELHPRLREHLAAFVQGINDYMTEHPATVPEWWQADGVARSVDVFMPVAFSRQFIWGWPAGQAASDLRKIGLRPSYDVDLRASNEIALAPSQTAFGHAALIIDPHLAWLGRQRYWELRLHAGDIHIAGFATAGFPYVNLGHNQHIAWAHTTGGPDTADVYELTLDPENSLRYRYDDEWREITTREVELEVLGEEAPHRATFHYAHYGPIIARDGNQAYAAALAYEDQIGYLESKYWFMVAEDYRGAIKALDVRQIMPQNVMVADTGGNIYYQRTGRVPIRPGGYDWSAPVDGSTSATEWQGIHPASDLMSLLNPERGWMQNCNIGPDTMLVDSPLRPETTQPYLYGQPPLYTHQRGSSAAALLSAKERAGETWTEAELLELAVDITVYQADRWQRELARALEQSGESTSSRARDLATRIAGWNGRSERDSNGALAYYAFRRGLVEVAGDDKVRAMIAEVNDYLEPFRGGSIAITEPVPPGRLPDADLPLVLDALEQGAAWMAERPNGADAVFGDIFRVGRLDADDDVSWPVGGGSLSLEGMATLRAIGFESERPDGTRWGSRGQTSTELVILSDPIQSWTQPPIGQSDLADSPHYRDQAEKLFGPGKLKPTWFHRDELMDGHVRSQVEIRIPGG